MPFFLVFLLLYFPVEPPEGFAGAASCLFLSLFLPWLPGGLPFLLYIEVIGPVVLLTPLKHAGQILQPFIVSCLLRE